MDDEWAANQVCTATVDRMFEVSRSALEDGGAELILGLHSVGRPDQCTSTFISFQ